MVNMTKQEYNKYVASIAEPSPLAKNMVWAFCVGGTICAVSEVIRQFFMNNMGMPPTIAGTCLAVLLVGLAALLTGAGLYDKLAKHAGAGTLIPITGFANAMVSTGIEFKSEGLITGVAGKMFIVAGPVLVYGTSASILYGVIYWLVNYVF